MVNIHSIRKKLLLQLLFPAMVITMAGSLLTCFLSGATLSGQGSGYLWILMLIPVFSVLITGWIVISRVEREQITSLRRLEDALIRLGNGDLEVELPLQNASPDIARLYRSFNTMVLQIRNKSKELQTERTGRLRSFIDGEEMERQRLSRELHDGIGQLLIAIKLRLESLLYQDGPEVKNSIQELKRYFDQIIDEVRRISNNLMPSVLEAFGLVIAFRNLFSETEEHSGVRIHFEARGDFDIMEKKLKTYIYRLTQEALNNIVKHAEAKEVWINLTRINDLVTLTIKDNGKGFQPDLPGRGSGNGIPNMRERASLLHGQIAIKSLPGIGTTINLNVPIVEPHVDNQDFPRG